MVLRLNCTGLAVIAPAALALACAASAQTGLIPLTDLGPGMYQGFQGGLYPGGLNTPPPLHFAAAMDAARAVRPLDADGQIDPQRGWIGMLSIGMSNTSHEFSVFERQEDLNPARNARVVILDGALGGQTASDIAPPDAMYWGVVADRLAAAGLTPAQVQVVWIKQAERQPQDNFPIHAQQLRDNLELVVNNLHDTFPNLKLCYLSSRVYGGYSATNLNPEPMAYESGFSVKWLIEDQIEGDPGLNFDPDAGPVEAPVLLWGPYMWADGPTPRADGLVWLREDFEGDGVHPSPSGEQKVADLLSGFFAAVPTARPWWGPRPGVRLMAFAAADDAWVNGAAPTTNYGNTPDLRVQAGDPPARTYLRFELPQDPEPALRAKLSLRVISRGGDGDVAVVPNAAWDESTITFANAPALGPPLVQLGRSSRDGSIAADVTGAVNADTVGAISLALTGDSPMLSNYRSRQDGQPPRLVLVIPRCGADYNADETINSQDYYAFLGAFFAGDPAADFNGDGELNSQDYFAYLGAFFNAC